MPHAHHDFMYLALPTMRRRAIKKLAMGVWLRCYPMKVIRNQTARDKLFSKGNDCPFETFARGASATASSRIAPK